MKKDGTGWAGWSLGRFIEKSCTVCTKRGNSCLRVVVNDYGDIDLGACVWCKARSVGCNTAQRRGRRAKVKVAKEPKDSKRKASEVDSGATEAKGPSPKKVKSRSVIEDSEEEWEGIEDKENGPQASGEGQEAEEVREEVEGVQEGVEEVQEEVTEEVREMGKREAKRVRREARRSERRARRSERSDRMDELIDVMRDLGDKVDKFAEEVRVSNVLSNRADREYLEERRWYFSDRMLHARDWQEDSDVDSEGHLE
jgi:hypothetical protein